LAEWPATVRQLLFNRGLDTKGKVEDFLQPDYAAGVHDPFLFRQMTAACARVYRALSCGEKIIVHGDYDADGVTGTTVLVSTFRNAAAALGVDPELIQAYFPHRERDGYGVREESVRKFAADGYTLMITVDCGIGNAAEVAVAAELGMDSIVVDHHQVPERVPDCLILHPLVEGETYPFKKLAAVGVAYKFATGFIRFMEGKGTPLEPGLDKWLLDLVAIATVTDIMPLLGENRVLEKFGLVVLNKTRRPGLRRLIEMTGQAFGELDTMSVGFYIGPRINAASRMDHAEVAYRCLMAKDEREADHYAGQLNRCNQDRQKYTEDIFKAARQEVADRHGRKSVICVAGEGWSPGVVGIVAGRLVNEFGVPAFVFGRDGDRYVGSGRSIAEFNVIDAMNAGAQHLERFGGHPQACGLTISGPQNYGEFKLVLERCAAAKLDGLDLRPAVAIDAEMPLRDVNWELVEWLGRFEPHGEANPRPKFLFRGLSVSAAQMIGKTSNTLRLGVRGPGVLREVKFIGFGMANRAAELSPGAAIDAVAELGVNEWNGRREIQFRLIDVKPAGEYAREAGERLAEQAGAVA
jgi:single-stranded-DNA-specific exonuclease